MKKRILVWLGVAALVVLAVVALALKPAKEPPKATFQAANGNVLTFMGVTYGRTNTMPIGKPYQQMLYKLLPGKLKKWSGARIQTFAVNDTNNPSFWVHESQAVPMVRPGGSSGFGGGPMRFPFLGLGEQPRILDEYGCEFAPAGMSTSSSSSSGERLSLIQLTGNPPQGRMAALCLYDTTNGTQRTGRFLVPGVELVVLPEPSQPLQEPKLVGELSVQLVRFITGLKAGPSMSVASNGVAFSQAEFRVTRKGVPVLNWLPNDVWLADARGRTVSTGTRMSGRRGSNVVVNFSTILDPAVGPYRVQARLVRDWPPAPEETVTFTGVALPRPGETLQPGTVAEAGTGRVTLKTAYGEGAERPVNLGTMDGRYVFEAVIPQPSPDMELTLVEATLGAGGSRITSRGTRKMGDGTRYFSLDPPAEAQTVDLKIGLYQRVVTVEFEATPEVFTPGGK